MKEKIIFNPHLAAFLRKSGFKIIRTEPNNNRPQYDVYIFNWSEQLENTISVWLTNRS